MALDYVFHLFSRWTGLWHIWLIGNAFILDTRLGIHGHNDRIKGLLLWQLPSMASASVISGEQAAPLFEQKLYSAWWIRTLFPSYCPFMSQPG